MDLITRCVNWLENHEPQKVVNALEDLPLEERNPQLNLLLSQAYCSVSAGWKDRATFSKVVRMLRPIERLYENTYSWNVIMGCALTHLEQWSQALGYLRKAVEITPESEEGMQPFIERCLARSSMPLFTETFRQRVENAWKAFEEGQIRFTCLMAQPEAAVADQNLRNWIFNVLKIAFENISFGLHPSDDKLQVFLSPEGTETRVFELQYFVQHAPSSIKERWEFVIGRQKDPNFALVPPMIPSGTVKAEDVKVWIKMTGLTPTFSLSCYCEKLLKYFPQDSPQLQMMLPWLACSVIGEIPVMNYFDEIKILKKPLRKRSSLLPELPKLLEKFSVDVNLEMTAEDFVQRCYRNVTEEWSDEREEILDREELKQELEQEKKGATKKAEDAQEEESEMQNVFRGKAPRKDLLDINTKCPIALYEFECNRSWQADKLEADGAILGYIAFSTHAFRGLTKGKDRKNFQTGLVKAIESYAGADAATIVGTARSQDTFYLDFIAWDFPAVMNAVQEYLLKNKVKALFHTFRQSGEFIELNSQLEGEAGSDSELLSSFADGPARLQ